MPFGLTFRRRSMISARGATRATIRNSNNRVTFAILFINNSRRRRGVQLVETLIIYENKMHVFPNRPHGAELDHNRCISSHPCLTNNDATRDDAASTALCAKDHDRHASVL